MIIEGHFNIIKMKKFLSLTEFFTQVSERPKPICIWGGITDKSFGFIFGPAKSGKTIFCENLAMSLAIGRDEFFGKKINSKPQKVLIVGLEEFWANRGERNLKQFEALKEEEKQLLYENLLFQNIDFQKYVVSDSDWADLKELIIQSKAETVIIDSLTRLNHSIIEDSKVAQDITERLRAIKDELDINLFVIHHSTKNQKNGISMDSMAGSRVFSQEADFAIAISKVEGYQGIKQRYLKQIFYRYADDNFDTVSTFDIDHETIWLNYTGEAIESDIISGKDYRTCTENPRLIQKYFQEHPTESISKKELEAEFVQSNTMAARTLEYQLKSLTEKNFIIRSNKGIYKLNEG